MMKKAFYILLVLFALIEVLTIIFFNGTGDAGDSVYHYLYARYAPVHPALFFDHWAKPVFVLLACPFAQFGFTGVKVFNALATLGTIFLTWKTAGELKMKYPVVSAVIMFFTPLYYILTFSGLTEPLFALFTAAGLYLSVRHKFAAAALVVSFLPYVRSEGLIMLGVFCLYFILEKRWKTVPVLLAGSVIYSVAGYFVHHDLLWVFSKIPYAKLSSTYGSGNLFHFVNQMFYVTGVPIFILFCAGLLDILRRTVLKKIPTGELVLVFLGFAAFFVAHSLFWYLGIFNSMGLKRVLLCVMPMVALISLRGFILLTDLIPWKKEGNRILRPVIQGIFIAYMVIFPFTSNPAAINRERDLMLSREQELASRSAVTVSKEWIPGRPLVCSYPYMSELLGFDYFDSSVRLDITRENINRMKAGDLLVWENWLCVVEWNIPKADLDNDPSLVNIFTEKTEERGREIIFAIYTKQ